MDKMTVTWPELKALSDKHFRWHSTHFSRKWEYPWAASQLAEMGIRGKSIMDAGAGKSPLALWLAENGAITYTVDSDRQVGTGSGFFDYGKLGLGIISVRSDFRNMAWIEADALDAITSISVIEHITANARRRTWAEFRRVLKPGGLLILTLDLVGSGDRLLNKCAQKRVEGFVAHGHLSDVEWELRHNDFIEVDRALCPRYRRKTKKERTTHVVGLVMEREG